MATTDNSNLSAEVKENTRRLHKYNISRVALKIGKMDDAKKLAAEFSKEASDANNTFQISLSHSLNGMIAMQEGKYKDAISQFEKSNQQNPQTFYYLAVAYQKDGDTEKAKKYAEKCANFNALLSLPQSFVNNKAKDMLASL
jgi:tetratricopeptide (TPR) repeat protein